MSNKLFVFDTNAFVSATLLAGSVDARALDKAFKTGKVVVSAASFAEFTEILFRKKFDKYFTDERRLQVVERLERDTVIVDVNISIKACRDPKDDMFLELAVTAGGGLHH